MNRKFNIREEQDTHCVIVIKEKLVNVLHCMPLGESMLPEFIRRLQEAGEKGSAGRMALVLPSPYLLEQARTRLRLTDVAAWEFPRILSLDELAAYLAGVRKISRLEQEFLINGIVRESMASGRFPYFGGIADFPGFITALARLFDEFKMAAVTSAELVEAIEALQDEVERNAERDVTICALFEAYQEKLADLSRVDLGGMYEAAIEQLTQRDRRLPFDRIFLAEFSVLSPVRLRLIQCLKSRQEVELEIGICFENNRPGVFRSVEPVYDALLGMGFQPVFHPVTAVPSPALSHLRRELFAEQPVLGDAADGIRILSCPNRAKELCIVADQVKALLLEREVDPQSVAVVTQDPAAYSRLRAEFADRGVPVDRAEAVPILERSLSRLVFDWLALVRERGSRTVAFTVLKSPYVAQRLDWDGDELERSLLGEVLLKWEDWLQALARQAPDEPTSEDWRDNWQELRLRVQEWESPADWTEWARRLRELLLWLDVSKTLKRRRQDGTLSLAEVRAELGCLDELLAAADAMQELSGFGPPDAELPEITEMGELLRQLLTDAAVVLEDRQDAGVQVVTPETGSGMRFRTVFVLGLAEGEFPAPPRESWLYDDRERRTLGEVGVVLRSAGDRAAAADFAFALAAGMATEELVLSVLADSETLPSRFVGEVTRLFAADAVAGQSFGLDEVVASQPASAWSRQELIKAALHHVWNDPETQSVWQQYYDAMKSWLPARLTERAAIESGRAGTYAGIVDKDLIENLPLSPSALEQYAACPFSYFAATVLKLGEWEPATEGFDVLSAGSVWHEVLAAFLGKYRGRRLAAMERDRYEAELAALLADAVARRERQGRLTPDVWWRFEQPRWEQALHDWLAGEIQRQQEEPLLTPSYFEWAFGTAPRPGSDPASTERPLTLTPENGEAVELQGKVDRIDVGGDRCRIIDYKTGKPPSRKLVEQGVRLQVPLYMLAVAELLAPPGQTDIDGMYLQVGSGSAELGVPGKMPREELLAVTKQAVLGYAAGIRDGRFPAQPAMNCPDWCLARTFCRRGDSSAESGTEEPTDE